MLRSQTIFTLFLATTYQIGYLYFYYDNLKEVISGEKPPKKDLFEVFTDEGYIKFDAKNILRVIGLGSDSESGYKGFGMLEVGALLIDFLKVCWADHDSKRMLIFLTINLLFMFVELFYGIYSNSLGLISDSFHMLSDCLSLFVALAAAYISTGKANSTYTYGYARAEVISGLFNGIFLVFVGFNVLVESVERIYEP